jgi:hypothetical protein
MLDEHRPGSASCLHDDPGAGGHPWSVSSALRAGGQWWFRVTTIGATATRLVAPSVRSGRVPATGGWVITDRTPWRARAATLGDLVHGPAPSTAQAVVTLLGPVTFSGGRRGEREPWPEPHVLFDAWRRRWLAHVGPDAGPPLLTLPPPVFRDLVSDCAAVLDERIWAGRQRTSRSIGARCTTGAVLVDLRGHEAEVSTLLTLLRFAGFAGTGRRLAFGFGQTAVGRREMVWDDVLAAHRTLRPRETGERGTLPVRERSGLTPVGR